jgi:hypothetical protein
VGISSEEPRRPRRITAADPASPAPALRAVPALLGERFQRSLGSPTQALQHKAAATTAQAGAAATRPAQPLPEPAPLQAPEPPAERTDAAAGIVSPPPPPDQATPLRPQQQPTATGPAWEQSLAQLVHTLCSSSDPSITHWTIQVPLDPDALPETTLHLALSPRRLQLRFNTQSSWSLRLLSDRTKSLVQLLQQTLPDLRDIDVELT